MLSIIGCNNRETLNGPSAAALRGYRGSKADQLNQAEVFQAAGGIHQLMRGHFNRDGETVGGRAGVNATIVHQGHFDLVEHDCDTTAVKLLGQVPDGEADAGGFHKVYSRCVLLDQLRFGVEIYPVNCVQIHMFKVNS